MSGGVERKHEHCIDLYGIAEEEVHFVSRVAMHDRFRIWAPFPNRAQRHDVETALGHEHRFALTLQRNTVSAQNK
jgi:hypothetical protein